jgi:SecD/SecF fusion protein
MSDFSPPKFSAKPLSLHSFLNDQKNKFVMPLKGLVKFFALVLIILCLFQLSFTYFVNKKDKEIEAKVKNMMSKEYPTVKYPNDSLMQAKYEDTLETIREALLVREENKAANQKVAFDPFKGSVNYQQAKGSQLQLGLDLQGGMSVTMEVATENLLKSLSNYSKDANFNKALQIASQKKANSGANFINLFRSAYNEIAPNSRLAGLFAANSAKIIKYDASDDAAVSYLKTKTDEAFDNALNVIKKRVDQFGLVQPNVFPDRDNNTISIEMAGVKNPESIKKQLQTSANLEMWEVAKYGEVAAQFTNADKAYTSGISITPIDTTKGIDTTKPNIPIKNNADLAKRKKLSDVFKPSNGNHIGSVADADTVFFNEMLASDEYKNAIPAEIKIAYGKKDEQVAGNENPIYALKTFGDEKPQIGGAMIVGAFHNVDPTFGKPYVSLELNTEGKEKFRALTKKLAGRGAIAIALDNIVYSAPNVNEEISGGTAQISGGFQNIDEAKDLSDVLKTGRMDVPARIVQDNVVGPTLGKKAVQGGFMSFAISFLVIFALMLVYYSSAGWVANAALILNLLFTIGMLGMLGATLTAPGIAGLVLTIGMAVDTNVIIFERIKEELEKGKTYLAAVAEGYKKSLAPVLDAHFTTFLTAAILFYFGLGPIKGFATTQMLGIFLSLFCGILISRLITDFFTNKNKHLNYFTPIGRRIFKHANFKFIEYRKVTYIISAVVLLMGVAAIFHGFDTGVEYAGGRSYTVQLEKNVSAEQLRTILAPSFGGKEPIVKSINNSDRMYDITTDFKINEAGEKTALDSTVRKALYNGIKAYLPATLTELGFQNQKNEFGIKSSKKVEPSISDDLKSGAKKAAIYSILIIALYIFIRFRDWRYSLGTIVALLHDVFVTLAVFSFFKGIMPFPLELDQHFIAAILTVIGFSMNDTIIVFDRIRENAKLMKGQSKEVIINKSINDTLSRTIMTSLTVFLTILILFIFGGEVTRGFAFAMLVGVIVGTYSSIFVAAPILVDFAKDKPLGTADFIDHSNETTVAAEKAIR